MHTWRIRTNLHTVTFHLQDSCDTNAVILALSNTNESIVVCFGPLSGATRRSPYSVGSHARSASSRIVAFSTAGADSGDKLEVHGKDPVPRISVPRRRLQERARSGDFFNMTSSTCSQPDYRDRLPRPVGLENIHSVWRRALRTSLFGSSAGEVDENSSGGPP